MTDTKFLKEFLLVLDFGCRFSKILITGLLSFLRAMFIWEATIIDFQKSSQGYAYLGGYHYSGGKSKYEVV